MSNEEASRRGSASRAGRADGRAGGRGRPPKGASLVEELSCSELARERLRVVLETLSGTMTIEAACAALDVGPSRFHAMRTRFLAEAAELLEPRSPGPAKVPEATESARLEVDRLKREVDDLRLQLMAAHLREELALAMPARKASKSSKPTGSAAAGTAGAGPAMKKKKRRVRRSR